MNLFRSYCLTCLRETPCWKTFPQSAVILEGSHLWSTMAVRSLWTRRENPRHQRHTTPLQITKTSRHQPGGSESPPLGRIKDRALTCFSCSPGEIYRKLVLSYCETHPFTFTQTCSSSIHKRKSLLSYNMSRDSYPYPSSLVLTSSSSWSFLSVMSIFERACDTGLTQIAPNLHSYVARRRIYFLITDPTIG